MPDMKLERLYHDPTPNQVVAYRLALELYKKFEWSTLSDVEQRKFQDVMRSVSLKLIAAWKSADAYREVTIQMVEESRASPRANDDFVRRVEPSQELYEHLDAFLTQFKSSLDYLVKAGCPIFGRRRWTLRTFSKKGKGIVKALGNLPAEFNPPASQLSRFVSSNEIWLGEVIMFRDWMNHGIDGGVDPSVLTIHSEKTGEGVNTYCPLFKDVPLEDYLIQMWWNLFHFAEAFVAYLLWARAEPGVRLYYRRVVDDSQQSPWALFPEGLLEQIGHPAQCVGRDNEETGVPRPPDSPGNDAG